MSLSLLGSMVLRGRVARTWTSLYSIIPLAWNIELAFTLKQKMCSYSTAQVEYVE